MGNVQLIVLVRWVISRLFLVSKIKKFFVLVS